MKKAIILMITVLGALYIILSILGAGGEYAAEKLFFSAMKVNYKIMTNPDVAPPALLQSVEKDLQKLISKYPKTNIAKRAHMSLAEFYAAHKEYDKAVSAIANTMGAYHDNADIVSTALFLKGLVYEKQGKWDEALTEFAGLRDKYPHTQYGIHAPLYIARHYDSGGNDQKAKSAYEEAEAFYANMEKENTGKSLGYIAANMLTQTFLSSKNYERAGESIKEVINKYPSATTFIQVAPVVDVVYIEKLKRPDEAIDIYKSMKSKIHDDKFIKLLDKKIKNIEGIKK